MAVVTTPMSSAPPQLRPLNILSDLPAVADLVESCFADTMDAEGRRYIQQMRRSSRDNAFLRWASAAADSVSMPLSGFVWLEDGRIVGNVSLVPHRRQRRKIYLLANVAVQPQYRRRGIGRALAAAAIQHARQNHAEEIWLHVRDDNPGAIQLYRGLGFVEQARRTAWQARPDRHACADGLGVTVSRNLGGDWARQEPWLRRLYPDLLAWYSPVPWTTLRPGLGPALYRFLFLETERRAWAVHSCDGLLEAALTWQPVHGQADRLWAAVPPEGAGRALAALLLQARRELAWRQALTLEFPAGEYCAAIEAAGFRPLRTLIWMRLDETGTAGVRISP